MSERTAQVLYWAALASLLTAICVGIFQNWLYAPGGAARGRHLNAMDGVVDDADHERGHSGERRAAV